MLRVVVSDTGLATAEVLPMVVAAGVRLARFERVRPTLEDVFLQLVGAGGGASVAGDPAAPEGDGAGREVAS
jgi:hypothetical protein